MFSMDHHAISLFKRMTNQGGSRKQILKQIAKAISRHPKPIAKYTIDARKIMNDINLG